MEVKIWVACKYSSSYPVKKKKKKKKKTTKKTNLKYICFLRDVLKVDLSLNLGFLLSTF